MLRIEITVRYNDGRVVPTPVGPVTQVAFERTHGVGISAIATDQRLSHVYWLAWHASRTGVEFDTWLESVEAIDFATLKPVDPTVPAPAAG